MLAVDRGDDADQHVSLEDVPLKTLPCQVKHHLGSGAFAHVYSAVAKQHFSKGHGDKEQPATPTPNKHVALKVFRAEFNGVVNGPRDEALMLSEAFCLKRLKHPSIVQCYDVCLLAAKTRNLKPHEHPDQALTMVMEYMEGGSLARLTYKQMAEPYRQIISDTEALELLLDVARGLCHIHKQDPPIMHRDVKQENVLLTSKGGQLKAKLADFGLHVKLDRGNKQSLLRRKQGSVSEALACLSDTQPSSPTYRKYNTTKPDLLAVQEDIPAHLSSSGVVLLDSKDGNGLQGRARSISNSALQSGEGVFFSPRTPKSHLFASGRISQQRMHSCSSQPVGAVAECLRAGLTTCINGEPGPVPVHTMPAAAVSPSAAPSARSVITSIPNTCSTHSLREKAAEQQGCMSGRSGLAAAVVSSTDAPEGGTASGQLVVLGQHAAAGDGQANAPGASDTSSQDVLCLGAPPLQSVFATCHQSCAAASRSSPSKPILIPALEARQEREDLNCEELPTMSISPTFMPGLAALSAAQSPPPSSTSPPVAHQQTTPPGCPHAQTTSQPGSHPHRQLQQPQQQLQEQLQQQGKAKGRASIGGTLTPGCVEQERDRWETPVTPVPGKVLSSMASIGRTMLALPPSSSINSTLSGEASKHGASSMKRGILSSRTKGKSAEVHGEGMSAEKVEIRRALASEFQWVFNLTAETGSLIYMSPEVYRGEPYNQAADVYSFGVLMYEVFDRSMLILTHINAGRVARFSCPEEYAKAASQGFRPVRTGCIPDDIWHLITVCWDQDPIARPTMDVVVARLEDICNKMPKIHRASVLPGAPTCACSVS